jgi:hypothetical protein
MMAIKKMSKQEKIDEFVLTLQKVIDIRYKINKETDLCNHTYVIKNLNPVYGLQKTALEEAIKNLLDNNSEI